MPMKNKKTVLFLMMVLVSFKAWSQDNSPNSNLPETNTNLENPENSNSFNADSSNQTYDASNAEAEQIEEQDEIGSVSGAASSADDIFDQLDALNSGGASFYESYKTFIYNPSNRKSPFLPPKNLRTKTGYKDQEVDSIRTGLLAYDLESLTLTSLLWSVDEPRALIKDPSGQTHKVKEGVLIGRKDGYIAKIREGEVVVVEKELVRGEDGLEKEIFKTQVLKMER